MAKKTAEQRKREDLMQQGINPAERREQNNGANKDRFAARRVKGSSLRNP